MEVSNKYTYETATVRSKVCSILRAYKRRIQLSQESQERLELKSEGKQVIN